LVFPNFLAGGGVQTADDLVIALPRKDKQLITNQSRRGDTVTDVHFQFLRQLLGPGGRGCEAGDLGVAICPAPLRPVLSLGVSRDKEREADGERSGEGGAA